MHGVIHRTANQLDHRAKKVLYQSIYLPVVFQFHLEHQFLLYPEPAYRIYQYPVARHLRYQLYIEELSSKQNQLNTFHTLRNMVVVCNLFEWVYIDV